MIRPVPYNSFSDPHVLHEPLLLAVVVVVVVRAIRVCRVVDSMSEGGQNSNQR